MQCLGANLRDQHLPGYSRSQSCCAGGAARRKQQRQLRPEVARWPSDGGVAADQRFQAPGSSEVDDAAGGCEGAARGTAFVCSSYKPGPLLLQQLDGSLAAKKDEELSGAP